MDEDRADAEGREITDADECTYDEASEDETRALMALLETPATTPAGMRASLEYLAAHQAKGAAIWIGPIAGLLKSPILA